MFFKLIIGLSLILIVILSIYLLKRQRRVVIFKLYDSPKKDVPVSFTRSIKDLSLLFCGRSGEIKNIDESYIMKTLNVTSGLFSLGNDIYFIDTLDKINEVPTIGDLIVIRDKDTGCFFYDQISFMENDPEDDVMVYYLEKNVDYPISIERIIGKLYYKQVK